MAPALSFIPRTISTPSSIVQVEYNPETLLPVPTPEWTRFVCISDTHTKTFDVPDGDILLHSGDLTNTGTFVQFQKTIDWLCSLPHKRKIIIAGNHDLTLDAEWYKTAHSRWHKTVGKQDLAAILEILTGPRARDAGLVYLQDSSYEYQSKPNGRKWTFYGSPWSPYYHGWAFNYHRSDGDALHAKFPKVDILLTHTPPLRILDLTRSSVCAGCASLRDHLPRLRPRLHIFGHVHEAHGAHVHSWGQNDTNDLPEVNKTDDDEEEEDGMENLGVRFDEEDNFSIDEAGWTDPGSEEDASDEEDGDNDDEVSDNDVEGIIQDADHSESDGTKRTTSHSEETVFVNAAASPHGKAAWRGAQRVPFAGPGFQPVIVDLRD